MPPPNRHCPACGRERELSEFPSSRAKNCIDCREREARRPKRKPFPPRLVALRRRLEAETGVPHVIDHIVPRFSRSRPTHSTRSVLICGLDVEENYEVVPRKANASKAWYFSEEERHREEVRLLEHLRSVGEMAELKA